MHLWRHILRVNRLLCVLALAWGAGAPVSAAYAREALRFGIAQAPITLDPRYATDATSERICRLLYRKLVDFNAAYEPVPQLADWERLSPTHYRFTLREGGRTFHDGSRLTAADVKATFESVLEAANASPHRGSLAMIARIDTPDTEHVSFHLAHPDALFPGRLTLGIVPQRLIASGHRFERQPVGSGPFRLRAWPDASRLALTRVRDDAQIEFVTVPNPTVRALKLKRGEIDMLQGDMPPELYGWLERQPRQRLMSVRGDSVVYMGFNTIDPITRQWQVRAAIAHAVDREAIIRHVFHGAAQQAASVLAPSHWAAHPGLRGVRYDPTRSRALLHQAGYGPEHPLRIVYKTSSDAFRMRLATILQSQLKQVGVEVDLRSYDWGTFYSDIKAGRFQMYTLSWVGLKLPDIFRYAFHSASVPPHGANRGRFADARIDALIAAAEASAERDEQAADYRAIQQRLLATLPIVPLWSEDVFAVTRAGVRGFVPAADGNYDSLSGATW